MPRAGAPAAYLVADPGAVPQALLHNLKHNQVLHERNVILTVVFHDVPWSAWPQRAHVEPLGHGFWRVTLNFGFMDTPDVPEALAPVRGTGPCRAAVRDQLLPEPRDRGACARKAACRRGASGCSRR